MYKYLLILCLTVLFSGCFDSSSLEQSKQLCIKKNKTFYIAEILNYRTGKYEPRVVCE